MPRKRGVLFSEHALEQMAERGCSKDEVRQAILKGEEVPAKQGRKGFRFNYSYDRKWSNKTYSTKQVLAIVALEPENYVVVTVYTFYF